MAKTTYFRIVSSFGLIVLSSIAISQGVKVNVQEAKRKELAKISEIEVRIRWLDEAAKYSGIREKGYNKHDSIQKINRWVGSPVYAPYCAAGLAYTAHNVGLDFPISGKAAVRNWFTDNSKVVWVRGREYRGNAIMMDVVWLFESHVEAIAQAKIRRDIQPDDKFMTVAFNTSGNTGGTQGIYYPVWRRWRDVRKIANHVTPYYTNTISK